MNNALVLVLNCGSSSIKYQLFDMRDETALAIGLVERIGDPGARLQQRCRRSGDAPWREFTQQPPLPGHAEGLRCVGDALARCGLIDQQRGLAAVGHRVVHGGERFRAPTLIDAAVVAGIRATIPLAPLHNPANLLGIETALAALPDVPQVAVFDTAFHHSLPPHAYTYALPAALCREHGIRRYGFHGTSHAHVAGRAAERLAAPLSALNLITLHLGNGASAAAIAGGRSIDTSMGMTPLEGLVMGSRSGDLDPAILFYLARETGRDLDQLDQLLNRDSGLTGVAGVGDMRELSQRAVAGDEAAELALTLFCYRIKKYIGAYTAALGRVDAIVFTGGIGEHSAEVRRRVCDGMQGLGIALDPARNRHPDASGTLGGTLGGTISRSDSAVAVLVIPTNEELEIARQAMAAGA